MANSTMTETGQPAAVDRRWSLFLISTAVSLYWISLYLYVPTLPVYAENKTNQDLAMVGVILSMYGLWQAILRLPLGIASDWLGRRKPFILAGFVLSGLGAYLMATATGADGLVVGRAVTGLAAAAWVPLVVVFSSLFPPEQAVRASALLSLVNTLSRVLATSITGLLNQWGGFSLAFYLSVAVAGLAILVTLPVRETARPPRRPSPRSIGMLITRRDVLVPGLLSAVGQYITWATTFSFLVIRAEQLGASGTGQSLLVSLNIGIGVVGNLVTSALSRRFGNLRLIYASYTMMVLGTLIAGLAGSLPVVFLAQALIGLGAGIGYPLCMGMSIEQVEDQERATAMGLHQAVYAIGMFAGPWLSGILAERLGLPVMFAITAAGALALTIGLASLLRKSART